VKHDFLNLVAHKVLVCDGAIGTLLQAHGLPAGACPEAWNIERPEIIRRIHTLYYQAGADIVETNTFGANRYRLGSHGFTRRVIDFNHTAARLACEVRPAGKLVAGSVGPTGEYPEPPGTASFKDFVAAFSNQIGALKDGGIDLVIIETMSDLGEIRAAIEAAKRVAPDLPLIASMTFEKRANKFVTMTGRSTTEMIDALAAEGVDIIGANCGTGMDQMIELIREFRDQTGLPLLSQANAGLPVWRAGKLYYDETPVERAAAVRQILGIGISIVGGCCGTTPDHIRTIRKEVDRFNTGH